MNRLKSRTVALQAMVQNTNEPYPRIIHGDIQIFERTPLTQLTAFPFVFDDVYLDWIREGKVVTIVFIDPSEPPDDRVTREAREAIGAAWPRSNLLVVELRETRNPLARSATQGGAPVSVIERVSHFNATAKSVATPGSYTRTFVYSEDRKRMWVFGPDLTSPNKIEVWLQDESGLPTVQLYPPPGRSFEDQVNVANIIGPDGAGLPDPKSWREYRRKGLQTNTSSGSFNRKKQIAGIEGSAYDPVVEARKRGKVIAIARFGNLLTDRDLETIHQIRRNEKRRALELTER